MNRTVRSLESETARDLTIVDLVRILTARLRNSTGKEMLSFKQRADLLLMLMDPR